MRPILRAVGACRQALDSSRRAMREGRVQPALWDRPRSLASPGFKPVVGIIHGVSVALTARRVLLALATSAEWERVVRALPGGGGGAYRRGRRGGPGGRRGG